MMVHTLDYPRSRFTLVHSCVSVTFGLGGLDGEDVVSTVSERCIDTETACDNTSEPEEQVQHLEAMGDNM